MIDLFTWNTPNGRKVSIMLEETGQSYEVHPVDITRNEQFSERFLRIAPNNRIPAIVDNSNGMTLMESGAILMYLANKTGMLLPHHGTTAYWRVIEWLMWQMGGVGPMLGQAHHFLKYNRGKSEYAEERYFTEAKRLYGVLDKRLARNRYIAGDYSIADIATWPWVSRFEWQSIDLRDYPAVMRWYLELAERPAVQRGYQVPHKVNEIPLP
ncbi:MAG: glutathione S-transferase family protein [Pseudomonadota bacterium]